MQNSSTGQKRGSLLWLLDRTKTAMGGRLLKKFIDQPLRDETLINERLDGVEELSKDLFLGKILGRGLGDFWIFWVWGVKF